MMFFDAWPLGWPGWRMAALWGVPVQVRIDAWRDEEAGVFVATSEQVPGLAVEAHSLDALKAEVDEALPRLLNLDFAPLPRQPQTEIIIHGGVCAAA